MKPGSISRQRWESFACLMLVAAAFGFDALAHHDIGTATAMGPGFFPLVLSVAMAGLAVMILLQPDASSAQEKFALRPFVAVVGGIAAFAALVGATGLFPATAVAVTVAAAGARGFSWFGIVCLGLAAAVFCTLVFVYGFSLPIPPFDGPFRWI